MSSLSNVIVSTIRLLVDDTLLSFIANNAKNLSWINELNSNLKKKSKEILCHLIQI